MLMTTNATVFTAHSLFDNAFELYRHPSSAGLTLTIQDSPFLYNAHTQTFQWRYVPQTNGWSVPLTGSWRFGSKTTIHHSWSTHHCKHNDHKLTHSYSIALLCSLILVQDRKAFDEWEITGNGVKLFCANAARIICVVCPEHSLKQDTAGYSWHWFTDNPPQPSVWHVYWGYQYPHQTFYQWPTLKTLEGCPHVVLILCWSLFALALLPETALPMHYHSW